MMKPTGAGRKKRAFAPIYETADSRHARILREFGESGATVEDLARAWASMDRKEEEFLAEKGKPFKDVVDGHYLGYLCETEEILARATDYANGRLNRRNDR